MLAGSIQAVVGVFPGALGDLLLAVPALRVLRARYPGAAFTIVVAEPLRTLARMAGLADEVESVDGAATAWLFGAGGMPRWLEGRPAVHSWLGARDPQVRSRLARVATHVSVAAVERGPGRVHAAVAYMRAVGAPADDPLALEPLARMVPVRSARAEAVLASCHRPLVVHRGAGAAAKRWSDAGFAEVAAWWQGSGGTVVELQGPAEDGEPGLPGASVVRGWALPDVAALLAGATRFIGNDSGVSHLAGAVGTTGVAVFGPTDPRRWRPCSSRIAVLAPAVPETAVPPRRVIDALAGHATLTSPEADTIDRA